MLTKAQKIEDALAFAADPPMSTDGYSPDYCYTPCDNGLHVCGHHPDGVNCLTVVNLPTPDAAEARVLFDVAKAECGATPDEPDDYVVDLQQNDDLVDDFFMSRQMLPRLIGIWAGRAALQSQEKT